MLNDYDGCLPNVPIRQKPWAQTLIFWRDEKFVAYDGYNLPNIRLLC